MERSTTRAYLVGGGIAALASASYLIRDGRLEGRNIHILEASDQIGGSLDAHGTPENGYVMRGGRMFDEEAYTCTFDLLSFIPSLRNSEKSVRDEFVEFNETFRSHSRSRLVANGRKVDLSTFGFSARDRMNLVEMMIRSEHSLGRRRIDECFQASFFESNFWFMWCTTFAFQPWHSAAEFRRYLLRFIQEFPRIETLAGVRRTPFNQYDSIVRPLVQWLRSHGVQFQTNCEVTDIDFTTTGGGRTIERIRFVKDTAVDSIELDRSDIALITLGSMTANSTLGTMDAPARLDTSTRSGAWSLWHKIAEGRPEYGRPSVFDGNVAHSLWESFTVTLRDPTFFRLMQDFTGNEAGTGGLVTVKDSSWLMSVVLPHQPHFLGQPQDVQVCWGYGLFPGNVGDHVSKPMADCSGSEILVELLSHLRLTAAIPDVLRTAACIPCMMPFITSQFLIREEGDRPPVRPEGAANFAFIGQFCEIPDDVVFTVEYSVRSAQIAVFSLLGLDKPVSPIYKGHHDPSVLFNSVKTLMK